MIDNTSAFAEQYANKLSVALASISYLYCSVQKPFFITNKGLLTVLFFYTRKLLNFHGAPSYKVIGVTRISVMGHRTTGLLLHTLKTLFRLSRVLLNVKKCILSSAIKFVSVRSSFWSNPGSCEYPSRHWWLSTGIGSCFQTFSFVIFPRYRTELLLRWLHVNEHTRWISGAKMWWRHDDWVVCGWHRRLHPIYSSSCPDTCGTFDCTEGSSRAG